jgi:AsmA family protein
MDGRSTALPFGRLSPVRLLLIVSAAIVAAVVIGVAAFPWGMLKGFAEQRLSGTLGRPVTIGALEREDHFSFHPVLLLRDIRVPQAAWAGGEDLARIGTLRLRLAALPLLWGDTRIEAAELAQARFVFVRDARGRKSWLRDGATEKKGDGGSRPSLAVLTVRDTRLLYRDAKRARSADVAVTADARSGVTLRGAGLVRGHPVTIVAQGGVISTATAAQAWPFRAVVEGKDVGMTMQGRMDRPLDFNHLAAHATAHGTDLRLVDVLIAAGLPGTQPVKLEADVRRDTPDWTVERLRGTIGRSDIAGHATIRKRDGRTRIDGALSANRFDFADLASNEGRRKAAADKARTGPRLLPNSAIDLKHVAYTDGTLKLDARQLLLPGSEPFRSLHGTLTVDHSRLTLQPLRLGLAHGQADGRFAVDQRSGAPVMDLALQISGGRLSDLFAEAGIDAPMTGRIRLHGPGRTLRAAIARSNGMVTLVARDGTIPARTASLLGLDVGRGVTAGKEAQAGLRCLIARFDVRGGIARPDPVVIDTSRAQTRASGVIRLADERLALSVRGAPKRAGLLRFDDAIAVTGTIRQPQIHVPQAAKSVGGVLKMFGKAITGGQQPLAGDADCGALAAQAMR